MFKLPAGKNLIAWTIWCFGLIPSDLGTSRDYITGGGQGSESATGRAVMITLTYTRSGKWRTAQEIPTVSYNKSTGILTIVTDAYWDYNEVYYCDYVMA